MGELPGMSQLLQGMAYWGFITVERERDPRGTTPRFDEAPLS